jgi:hypothetical protein
VDVFEKVRAEAIFNAIAKNASPGLIQISPVASRIRLEHDLGKTVQQDVTRSEHSLPI